MPKEDSVVGEIVNFRGLVYSPINEQGVVFLFGRLLEDLNMRIEEVRTKYPDCIARRYVGKDRWEKVYIEFEYLSSNFIQHGHDPKECDIIVCWKDDLTREQKKKIEGIEIIDLKSKIEELEELEKENTQIKSPETSKYDLTYHFNRLGANNGVKQIYNKLHELILKINPEGIFRKFSKTHITYYSPEKRFIAIRIQKTSINLEMIYTNRNPLKGVKNYKNHENWGSAKISDENEIENLMPSISQSYEHMKKAIKENVNTGWSALSSGKYLEEDEEELINPLESSEEDEGQDAEGEVEEKGIEETIQRNNEKYRGFIRS